LRIKKDRNTISLFKCCLLSQAQWKNNTTIKINLQQVNKPKEISQPIKAVVHCPSIVFYFQPDLLKTIDLFRTTLAVLFLPTQFTTQQEKYILRSH
jgi:hypothetical protein